ncbi:MAG: hypothetical protein US62_C0022G0010 [Candidatus Woesebacteria bacterium GW2011_GWA1_37_8]|uniref:Uncharacterized protein n=2 Tax=Candidatus Woeseibacteriota TaxID=1752722 RepID=A0A0G0NN22_9BACT|nr:MAG: hypothetical protein US39_C0001G0142 [Microgenomates group bacterium GW2011_GWC1_37_12b]KKQ44747.1 MAG: hypothetical protein US62_C0022G0010 [Candidatus Woesebacteria bacterium GW2011_GWA1_37_8]KKQ87294.1 MAG: hypothetical protein UT10_C0008G0055 [Candidatus Woesebacteria bacterium GW2011_GWB1_38_8b]
MLKISLKWIKSRQIHLKTTKIKRAILNVLINNTSIDELVILFKKRGGIINRYYLQATNRNKQALVYFKGWHRGSNIREAIKKALSIET